MITKTTDKDIEIWNVAEGKIINIISPFTNGITSYEIHPFGKWIVLTGVDEKPLIKVFDILTGSCKSTIPLEDNCTALKAGIHPTGNFFIVVKNLEKYTHEGKGFLQIYGMDGSDIKFLNSVSSSWKSPIATSPLLAFHPDNNQIYVAYIVPTEKQISTQSVGTIMSWTSGDQYVVSYDIATQKLVNFIQKDFMQKHTRLLKNGKTFIKDLKSPNYIQFNSTRGGTTRQLMNI